MECGISKLRLEAIIFFTYLDCGMDRKAKHFLKISEANTNVSDEVRTGD